MPKTNDLPSPGARLAAALISHQLGHPGLDWLLAHYVDLDVGPWWHEKANALLREMLEQIPWTDLTGSRPEA
jgi:hypothetical protein